MLKRNLWKLVLSFVIVLWAVFMLQPISDQPFAAFAKAEARTRPAEFAKLMDEAAALKASGGAQSEFVALRQIAKERKLDLTQYFPQIELEATLRNVEKRNDILLNELLRRGKGRVQLGLDLKGGVAFTLEVDPNAAAKMGNETERAEKLTKAIEIISQRINAFGVAEPIIRAVGNNRIEVQLPNVSTKDNPEIEDAVKKPARLDFRSVHPSLVPGPGVETPPGYEILTLDYENRGGQSSSEELFVKRIPEMTGEGIDRSFARPDMYGKPEIIMMFTKEGRKHFAQVTHNIIAMGKQAGRIGQLAIVLDGKLYSAPQVDPRRVGDEIDSDSAEITGSFTDREAINLANVLNNPLDLPLVVKEKNEIGPSLAVDAISSGVKAAIIGTAAVCGFMITYYTVGGVISVFTLAINLLVILGVMANIGATLTLPGLAGIVLTVGMAVDANILIYERMREELNLGKSMKTALVAGFDKALWTILDAHITQLSICAVMIWLGTGPIKGFGVTLAIGVFSTLFSVLVTGRLIMNFLIEGDVVTKFPMLHLFSNVKADWVKISKPAFIVSWSIVLIGLVAVFVRSDKMLGIDFTGGDQVTLAFDAAHKISVQEIRSTATTAGIIDINPAYETVIGTDREALKIETPYGKAGALVSVLGKTYPQAKFEKTGENAIGPTIGKEIAKNALLSVSIGLIAILLYIAFRFEFGFGVGAVVATIHDVCMTIGMFVLVGGFVGFQFNGPMVAAILAIIGYSVNDTVVVFDRIREELRLNPNGSLRDVVNLAINRVFSRSLMTSFTTFLAALSLFIFGGGVLRELAFTFLIGIITGTFSSICIAAQIFYWWHKGDRKHVEAHADVAPKYEWQGSSKASQ
jgi:SecD/SecF fusion protein